MTIDKSQLHPMFEKSLRRSERLSDLATRKALDLPLDDDMQIITNHTRQGFGLIGTLLLSTALLAGGGGAAIGALALLNTWMQDAPDQGTTGTELSTDSPPAQEFKITFWTDDGENLEVTENE